MLIALGKLFFELGYFSFPEVFMIARKEQTLKDKFLFYYINR